jgi:hypothetical protein
MVYLQFCYSKFGRDNSLRYIRLQTLPNLAVFRVPVQTISTVGSLCAEVKFLLSRIMFYVSTDFLTLLII